jgi:hypothetical protein
MIHITLEKDGECVNHFPIRTELGRPPVIPRDTYPTHILDAFSLSPDFDTIVFSKEDLNDFRHDWEAGEKNYWDEDTAKEWLENEYVKPVLELTPNYIDWKWG